MAQSTPELLERFAREFHPMPEFCEPAFGPAFGEEGAGFIIHNEDAAVLLTVSQMKDLARWARSEYNL